MLTESPTPLPPQEKEPTTQRMSYDEYLETFIPTGPDEYKRYEFDGITIPFQGKSADLLDAITYYGVLPRSVALYLLNGTGEPEERLSRFRRMLRRIDEKLTGYESRRRMVEKQHFFEGLDKPVDVVMLGGVIIPNGTSQEPKPTHKARRSRKKVSNLKQIRELAELGNLTRSEIASTMYPGLEHKHAMNRVSTDLSRLRRSLKKEGLFVQPHIPHHAPVVILKEGENPPVYKKPNAPKKLLVPKTDSLHQADPKKEEIELPTPYQLQDSDLELASRLREMKANEETQLTGELTLDDIIQIVSYRGRDQQMLPEDVQLLISLLDGEIKDGRAIPNSLINKLNFFLEGSGARIGKFAASGDEKKTVSVKAVVDKKVNPAEFTAQVVKRVKDVGKSINKPPFRLTRSSFGNEFTVHLESGKKRSSEVTLKPLVIDGLYGEDTEKTTLDIQIQLKLINFLLENPVTPRSVVSSAMSGIYYPATHSVIPRDLEELLRLGDRTLRNWGLGIQVYTTDKGQETIQLVPFSSAHTIPKLNYTNASYDEEAKALPNRQRRRQPSHGKLRL